MSGSFSIHKVREVLNGTFNDVEGSFLAANGKLYKSSDKTDYTILPIPQGAARHQLCPELQGDAIVTQERYSGEYLMILPKDWHDYAAAMDELSKSLPEGKDPAWRSFRTDTIESTAKYTQIALIGPVIAAKLAYQIPYLIKNAPSRPRWAFFAERLQEYFAKAAEAKAYVVVS